MTNEELERGFDDAREQWNAKNVRQVDDDYELRRLARYFFWAGSTFGVQATKQIYAEGYNRQQEIINETTEN